MVLEYLQNEEIIFLLGTYLLDILLNQMQYFEFIFLFLNLKNS